MTPAVDYLLNWISDYKKRILEFPGLDTNSIDPFSDDSIRFDFDAGRLIAQLKDGEIILHNATHQKKAEELIETPTHGLAENVLTPHLEGDYIFERTNNRGGGQWYRKNGVVWEPEYQIRILEREVLEAEIYAAHARLDAITFDGKKTADIFKKTGKAIQKAQSVDFLNKTEEILREALGVDPIAWNSTPDTLPCTDALIDFSGPKIKTREPEPGEYWRDPVPFTAAEIIESPHPVKYEKFLFEIFPDLHTNLTARYCRAAAIRGTGTKSIVIAWNSLGNGAKNTDFDVHSRMTGSGMFAFPSGALVTSKGDSGEKRFDSIRLRGARFAVFDEVTGVFDVSALKRLTSLSEIRGEAKGQDAVTFQQTWCIFILTNELPAFFPPDDSAFLNRLIVIPYQSVFYESEEQRQQLLERGADPEHLLPARDKREIIAELEPERPGILRTMIEDAIALRDYYGGKVPESDLCKHSKENYRSTNDRVESFLDEMIVRDSSGKIANSRLLELYQQFTGDKRTTSQTLVNRIKKKIPGIEPAAVGKSRGQAGIREVVDA